jgi:hypothetical protein
VGPHQQIQARKGSRMRSDDDLGWLALALTPGLGEQMAGKLLGDFGSPDTIFSASLATPKGAAYPPAAQ